MSAKGFMSVPIMGEDPELDCIYGILCLLNNIHLPNGEHFDAAAKIRILRYLLSKEEAK